MAVSRLLKSCATPPASRPTASIFCDWSSFCSLSSRAVSARLRACTVLRMLAMLWRKLAVSPVKSRGCSAAAVSKPKGFSPPPIMTARPLRTPRRASVAAPGNKSASSGSRSTRPENIAGSAALKGWPSSAALKSELAARWRVAPSGESWSTWLCSTPRVSATVRTAPASRVLNGWRASAKLPKLTRAVCLTARWVRALSASCCSVMSMHEPI